ncbi:MAG: hypothetical protein KDK78_02715 [Chlamydiia bacterium]|nr:hypothetical protein [Chlamydiia bacterium]
MLKISSQPPFTEQLTRLADADSEYEEFASSFRLGYLTTEGSNPITVNLSQTMLDDPVAGLQSLLKVDGEVLAGLEEFRSTCMPALLEQLRDKIPSGGRLFIVGAGTSGRIGLQMESKWRHSGTEHPEAVHGIIAGGDSALIRAREGFEDSLESGREVMQSLDLQPNDTVILLSASGSASFNTGAGREAATHGCAIYYFYNSESVPDRTQALFDEGIAKPLRVTIGAPAISGSSRLQPATLALMSFGALLSELLEPGSADRLITAWRQGQSMLADQLEPISRCILKGADILDDPRANFRRMSDETNQGYMRWLGTASTLFDILVDTTETAPTFSTNPPRRNTVDDAQRKRAEFQAYMAKKSSESQAWEQLLGRPVHEKDREDAQAFLITRGSDGVGAYSQPPIGPGNLVGAVLGLDDTDLASVQEALDQARAAGAQTVAMVLCEKGAIVPSLSADLVIPLQVPCRKEDPLGIVASTLTKQAANMVSNGIMARVGKLMGNRMVDVAISNNKLLDRCIRLLLELVQTKTGKELSHRDAYDLLKRVQAEKAIREARHEYTPSPLKIAAAMLLRNLPFDEALVELRHCGESIDRLQAHSTKC